MPEETFLDLRKLLGAEDEPSSQQLVLYIPDKDRRGRNIKNLGYWLKEARKILTVIGGGATAMPPADGSWLDPSRNIQSAEKVTEEDILWEKTTILYTYINADRFEGNLHSLREFLHRFGRDTHQGEVVFEFDGRFYRITRYD